MKYISKGLVVPNTLVAIFGCAGMIWIPALAQALGPPPRPAPFAQATAPLRAATPERLYRTQATCDGDCGGGWSGNPGAEIGGPDEDIETPKDQEEKPKGETPREEPKEPEEPEEPTDDTGGNTGTTTGPISGPDDEATDPRPDPVTRAVSVFRDDPDRQGIAFAALNSQNTLTIAQLIAAANRACGAERLSAYRIDCLRASYLRIADALPATGEYDAVKEALSDAAVRLDAIVSANLDAAAPPRRPRADAALGQRLPKLRAVKPEAAAAANAAAEQVVADTAMLILRSGENPKRRNAHYQEIAAAVNSNILLLRSA